jgi:hypothetical protein
MWLKITEKLFQFLEVRDKKPAEMTQKFRNEEERSYHF